MIGRLGRLLHWTLTGFAVVVLILALLNLNDARHLDEALGLYLADGTPSPESPENAARWHREQGARWLTHAIVAFVAGRATRYLLSAE